MMADRAGTTDRSAATEPAHGIRVVARRTGLNPDTIRAWERRYEAVSPGRSGGGRRLYSDAEVERLLLLRRATDAGRRISDVAGLDDEELRRLVESDAIAERRAPALVTSSHAALGPTPEDPVGDALLAVERLDASALETALIRASRDLPVTRLLEEFAMPLLQKVGERWREGTLRIAHEHVATAVLRSFLGGLRVGESSGATGPAIVVGTPSGQMHELGALSAAVVAEVEGWRATYLGANLPAADFAHAAHASGASMVGVSVIPPVDDALVARELRNLRRMLPPEVALVVGGAGASGLDFEVDAGIERVTTLGAFRDRLAHS